MKRPLSEVPFPEWLDYIFNRPITHPEWHFQIDATEEATETWDTDEPHEIVFRLTRLFREAGHRLAPYSPHQIRQGLWYLASNACSNYMFALSNPEVPLDDRRDCLHSFYDLNAQLFAPRCAAVLAHRFPPRHDPLREEEQRLHKEMAALYQKFFPEPPTVQLPQKEIGERIRKWTAERAPLEARLKTVQAAAVPWDPYPLNSICYMWWDILPFCAAPEDSERAQLDSAALDVMDRTLRLDSMACQENALHGLGHWQHQYPERVQRIVEVYIERCRPEGALLDYARQACSGCIL